MAKWGGSSASLDRTFCTDRSVVNTSDMYRISGWTIMSAITRSSQRLARTCDAGGARALARVIRRTMGMGDGGDDCDTPRERGRRTWSWSTPRIGARRWSRVSARDAISLAIESESEPELEPEPDSTSTETEASDIDTMMLMSASRDRGRCVAVPAARGSGGADGDRGDPGRGWHRRSDASPPKSRGDRKATPRTQKSPRHTHRNVLVDLVADEQHVGGRQ